MPTIAEMLAAKSAVREETKAADTDTKEAIDRIDPPGKRARSGGIVLTSTPPAPQPPPTPKADEDPRRSLTVPTGQDIPVTPVGADPETATWHEAMQAFESELCLVRHPSEPEQAWLAVKPDRPGLAPILIHRLPWRLWEAPWNPTTNDPF